MFLIQCCSLEGLTVKVWRYLPSKSSTTCWGSSGSSCLTSHSGCRSGWPIISTLPDSEPDITLTQMHINCSSSMSEKCLDSALRVFTTDLCCIISLTESNMYISICMVFIYNGWCWYQEHRLYKMLTSGNINIHKIAQTSTQYFIQY